MSFFIRSYGICRKDIIEGNVKGLAEERIEVRILRKYIIIDWIG
jgi:hypothetical protein